MSQIRCWPRFTSAADRKPQPGAAKTAGGGAVTLGERLEQAMTVFESDAENVPEIR
ncbi:hypothetical protein WCLP8_5370002 [uncultured Gammaproteobacteria bacterium]